jgi:hypothetical protein
VTNTTRLRAWARRIDPYSAGAIAVLAAILVSGLIRSILQSAPAPTIIIATQALPSAGQHGAVRRLTRAPAAQLQLPTAIVPTAAPVPTAVPIQAEQPAEQQFTIQNAPALEQPTAGAPRFCTGFGDWRDYDAMFASSPACHATP